MVNAVLSEVCPYQPSNHIAFPIALRTCFLSISTKLPHIIDIIDIIYFDGQELDGKIHALSVTARTPAQWEKNSNALKSPNCMGGEGRQS